MIPNGIFAVEFEEIGSRRDFDGQIGLDREGHFWRRSGRAGRGSGRLLGHWGELLVDGLLIAISVLVAVAL